MKEGPVSTMRTSLDSLLSSLKMTNKVYKCIHENRPLMSCTSNFFKYHHLSFMRLLLGCFITKKIYVRWVPKILSDEDKKKCMDRSLAIFGVVSLGWQ